MALILKADGRKIEKNPDNGKDFSLEELQMIVGGIIEIVELADGNLMVLHEEGKLIGLPKNHTATHLFQIGRAWYDPVVGDVLVCDSKEIK